jgi:indole-3-glycerol phosphate synthase
MKTILDTILEDVRDEVRSAKLLRSAGEIRAMCADAPAPGDFHAALAGTFGLIAEIKERSPSVGAMRAENVRDAAAAYAESVLVRAVSVLTNQRHFGMDVLRLREIRRSVPKPVLRKDFFLDEYQIREARAFGADAVLLMANVLDAARLKGFYHLARELGMEAIFEVHTRGEIGLLPADARIVGINSRKFRSQTGFSGATGASETDFSVDLGVFALAGELPSGCLRVAESGISPATLGRVRESFDCALVGTSLLRDPRGVRACLAEFEEAASR